MYINKLGSSPLASPWMFSSCLCSGSRNDLSGGYLGLSVLVFLLLLSVLCPAPLCVCSPFQAGAKMGHGATRISAPLKTSMGIEYSLGTGCSCGEPKILTSSAGKGNVSCYSVLFSL